MYDYSDPDKKLGVMTGIICFVFAAAVIAAAVVISYLLIWQNITHSSFVDKRSSKIFWMTVTCLFLGIGAICNIVSGVEACAGDSVSKAMIIISLLLGGVIPGIMLFLFNELWASDTSSSYSYSGGGSSGGTTYTSGSGKPKRPKYDRDDDERIVRKTSRDDSNDTPRRVTSTPKGKRFTKPGKPE